MEWMKGEELLDTVKDFCEIIAGSAMNESAKALGFSAMANGTLIKPVVNTTATQIIQFPGVSAAEAYAVGGTVATGAATSTAANLTLVNTTAGATAAGSSSAAGVLSVAAPIALSALAAVGGYLIGNEIYDHNQEFFDELLEPIDKFIYDGTQNFMALFDNNGYTYLDKRAYDILKAKLDSIPNTLEPYYLESGIDFNNTLPKCKLHLAAIEGLDWQISNGFNKYAEHPNYKYDCVVEAITKACDWMESKFTNKLIRVVPGYPGFADYRLLNGASISFDIVDNIVYSSKEENGAITITCDYLPCQITCGESDFGERTIFTVEEPQYGKLYYYCNISHDGQTIDSDVSFGKFFILIKGS